MYSVRSVLIRPGGNASSGTSPRQQTEPVNRGASAEQALPHGGTDAVGADDEIGVDLRAVGEARSRAVAAGLDVGAARAEMNDVVGQLLPQDLDQVGAMHRQVGRAELLLVNALAEHLGQDVTAVPGANKLVVRFKADGRDLPIESECTKAP